MSPLSATAAPPPQSGPRRAHLISLRVTPAEYQRIAERAASDRRSLGSFARVAVLDALDAQESAPEPPLSLSNNPFMAFQPGQQG